MEVRDPRIDVILDAVLDTIADRGLDAVTMQGVARAAKVSLREIYRFFPSRPAMCLAAMERWVLSNVYEPMPVPDPVSPPADQLVTILRHALAPYLACPPMLEAFTRLRFGPGGDQLVQGALAVPDAAHVVFAGTDQDLEGDLRLMVNSVLYAQVSRYAAGQIDLDELLPALEVTVRRVLDPARGRDPGTGR